MNNKYLSIAAILAALNLKCGVVEQLANRNPVIKEMTFSADTSYVFVGDTLDFSVDASDPDGDELFYTWTATDGYFIDKSGPAISWVAPENEGRYDVEVAVRDQNEGEAKESVTVTVLENREPSVFISFPQNGNVFVGLGQITVKAQAAPVEFINRVEFFFNDRFLGSDKYLPFEQTLDLDGRNGRHKIHVIAYRTVPSVRMASDSVYIMIEGVVPVPH